MEQRGLVKLETVRDAQGNLENAYVKVYLPCPRFLRLSDWSPKIDRQNVLQNGSKVMGELLRQLQIRKSVADGPGARAFYTDLTTPPKGWLTDLRDLVLRKKQVSRLFIPVLVPSQRYAWWTIAPQDYAPGEHGRRGWKSRVEGIPFDARGFD